MLKLTSAVVSRSNTALVTDINIELFAGEINLLTGANGSGKSTLLLALAGEKFLKSGVLEFDGVDFQEFPRKDLRKLRSLMLQKDEAIDLLRVSDVFELVNSKETKPKYVIDFIEKLVPNEILPKNIGELSIGQRSRVFLAATVLQNARLVLLDEPTAGLDMEITSELAVFLVEHAKHGHSILIATHDSELKMIANHEYSIENNSIMKR